MRYKSSLSQRPVVIIGVPMYYYLLSHHTDESLLNFGITLVLPGLIPFFLGRARASILRDYWKRCWVVNESENIGGDILFMAVGGISALKMVPSKPSGLKH